MGDGDPSGAHLACGFAVALFAALGVTLFDPLLAPATLTDL
jgi:hypothetical protein